jgi:hypothetical protein
MLHTCTDYRIEWQSGDYERSILFVDGVAAETGDWLELIRRAHTREGLGARDENHIGLGRYFVMFPVFRQEMTDADWQQLANSLR